MTTVLPTGPKRGGKEMSRAIRCVLALIVFTALAASCTSGIASAKIHSAGGYVSYNGLREEVQANVQAYKASDDKLRGALRRCAKQQVTSRVQFPGHNAPSELATCTWTEPSIDDPQATVSYVATGRLVRHRNVRYIRVRRRWRKTSSRSVSVHARGSVRTTSHQTWRLVLRGTIRKNGVSATANVRTLVTLVLWAVGDTFRESDFAACRLTFREVKGEARARATVRLRQNLTLTLRLPKERKERRPECPADKPGKYPDCRAPVCPYGTTGTPPDCRPIECPYGTIGKYPDCKVPQCPAGQIGVYPDCRNPPSPEEVCTSRVGYQWDSATLTCNKIYVQCGIVVIGDATITDVVICPDRTEVCPTGTTGVPPNCRSIECPTGTIGRYPDCRSPGCPEGEIGMPPNCRRPECPYGTVGVYPNCRTPALVAQTPGLAHVYLGGNDAGRATLFLKVKPSFSYSIITVLPRVTSGGGNVSDIQDSLTYAREQCPADWKCFRASFWASNSTGPGRSTVTWYVSQDDGQRLEAPIDISIEADDFPV